MNSFPFVSLIIVAYNEEKYIRTCLQSILNQNYPKHSYEIIFVDGDSSDNTLIIAIEEANEFKIRNLGNTYGDLSIKFLKNSKKILASGWNLGIKESSGEYIARIDAHSFAHEDYILESVKTILSVHDAVCVGGSIETKSLNKNGDLINKVLSSPFGVGGAKFRYKKTPGYVDTVAYGLYKRSVFNEVGFFDESLVRTQDNDMHRRIRSSGGKFFLNPRIKTVYFARDSIYKMIKQGYQNGKWTMINFKKNPGKMAIRHFIPFLFVNGIFISLFLGIFFKNLWMLLLLILLSHFIMGIVFSFNSTKVIKNITKMPFLFLALHVAYGFGSNVGLFTKIKKGDL